MKKLISFAMIIILVCALCACNSDNAQQTTNATAKTIAPDTINWGYDKENNKADRWYLKNSDDVTYIYFTTDGNSICTLNLVKSGVVVESSACVVTQDNHLVPADNAETFDLVFEDSFNAYDYITDSTYSRGVKSDYEAYFNDRVFADEKGENLIVFNSDGTFYTIDKTDTADSAQPDGSWEIVAQKAVVLSYGENKTQYTIAYNDDMTLRSISTDNAVFYLVVEGNEQVNKYKAY